MGYLEALVALAALRLGGRNSGYRHSKCWREIPALLLPEHLFRPRGENVRYFSSK